MNHMWKLIVVTSLLIFLISYLPGMYPSQTFGRDKIRELLNHEIFEATVAPTQNKYNFFYHPELSRNGLTYCFDVIIYIKNTRCKSFEEANLVHKQIYRDFLDKLNSIRIIRPFLAEFPLTPNSFYLSINFQDGNGKNVLPPYISAIYTRESTVKYFQENIIDKDNEMEQKSGRGYKIVKAVPLSDANWLKEYFSSSVVRKKADSNPNVPTYSRPFPGSCAVEKTLFCFEKKFADANGLGVVTSGTAGETEGDSRAFDFVLCGKQCINLEEAKKMASNCFLELLTFVRANQVCLDYMKNRSTWPALKDPSTFPESRHLAFRISFWDENIDRQPAPYIAEIRVVGDKFKYFTSDENQRLVLAYEETFDDAQAYLKSSDRSK